MENEISALKLDFQKQITVAVGNLNTAHASSIEKLNTLIAENQETTDHKLDDLLKLNDIQKNVCMSLATKEMFITTEK